MFPDSQISVDALHSRLVVLHPQAVMCRLNKAKRQVYVGRMELQLEEGITIPAGWTGKFVMVASGGRHVTICEGIVLPMIVGGIATPITPPLIEDIPHDVINSRDEWLLEFRIVDSLQHEAPFMRKALQLETGDAAGQANGDEAYEAKLRQLSEELERAREGLMTKTKEAKMWYESYDALRSDHEKAVNEFAEARRQFEQERAALALDTVKYLELIRGLESDKRQLVTEAKQLSDENGSLSRTVQEQQGQIDTLQAQLNASNVKLNEFENELDSLEGQLHNVKQTADKHLIKADNLESEASKLERTVQQFQEQLQTEQQETKQLRRRLEQAVQQATDAENTFQRQEALIERLKADLKRLETESSETRVTNNELANENTKLKVHVKDVGTKLDQVREDLHEAQDELEKYRTLLSGTLLFGQYELVRELEWGDNLDVYKVIELSLNRVVAIKKLPQILIHDERALNQLAIEANMMEKLTNQNTIRLINFVKEPEPYIVMEYVEGKTFRQLINTEGAIPLNRVLDYARQICHGLSYAHKQGIYHRNLKPELLMLTDKGYVKIMDFGVAASIRMSMVRLTGKMSVEAQRYLSPEQLRGSSHIDARTDIYCLGIILYEMLAGKPPFSGENIDQIIKDPPPLVPHMPREVNEVLQQCLEKKADDRYSTVEEVYSALKAAIAEDK